MSIQKMSWGQMEHILSNDDPGKQNVMSIGITTILPGVRMTRHVHYQVEQFIYVLRGEGLDIADGEERILRPGVYYYLPANITHIEENTGSEDLVHLTISVPTTFNNTVDLNAGGANSIYGAVEAIRSQLQDNSVLPIAIFDDMEKLVLQNGNYPTYCVEHCDPEGKPDSCPCFQHKRDLSIQAELCPYGLSVIRAPVNYNNKYLGSIFSGHILLSGEDLKDHGHSDLYETPLSTLLGIKRWLGSVTESLVSFCSFDAMRRSLSQNQSEAEKSLQLRMSQEAELRNMRTTVTNLRINRHFLFNTLNAIAGQALAGDKMSTYQSIVDLAKMLRYSSSDMLEMVPLRSEVEYLQTYLHMQQLRYMDDLDVRLDCSEEIMDTPVVYNFLQPILENAFTHGFSNISGQKCLKIRIWRGDKKLKISVVNNGALMNQVTLQRVQSGLTSNSGHGLSLIYSKLQTVYGNSFTMELSSEAEKGTEVFLEIPVNEQKGEGKP